MFGWISSLWQKIKSKFTTKPCRICHYSDNSGFIENVLRPWTPRRMISACKCHKKVHLGCLTERIYSTRETYCHICGVQFNTKSQSRWYPFSGVNPVTLSVLVGLPLSIIGNILLIGLFPFSILIFYTILGVSIALHHSYIEEDEIIMF